MSAEDASTKMLVIGRSGRSSRLVADKLLARATAWPASGAILVIAEIDPRVRRGR